MFLKFSNLTIADISDGSTYLVEIITPDMQKKIEQLEIPGNKFIDNLDRGLAEISFGVRAHRQFKTLDRVTPFLLHHILEISEIRKGNLLIKDVDGNSYEFTGVVLEGASTITQIGINLVIEYKFKADGIVS